MSTTRTTRTTRPAHLGPAYPVTVEFAPATKARALQFAADSRVSYQPDGTGSPILTRKNGGWLLHGYVNGDFTDGPFEDAINQLLADQITVSTTHYHDTFLIGERSTYTPISPTRHAYSRVTLDEDGQPMLAAARIAGLARKYQDPTEFRTRILEAAEIPTTKETHHG